MKNNPFHSKRVTAFLVIGLCLLMLAATLRAQVTVGSTGFDYSAGKYGSSTTTRMVYVPFTGQHAINDWTLKLTVPYIRIDGPGNVLPGLGPVGGGSLTTVEHGLGDVLASLGKEFYRDPNSGLVLGATGRIKLGTAKRSKGLGTGEEDIMFQLDGSRSFGSLMPFGNVGYRFLGDSPGLNLRNGFYGSAGAAYRFDMFTSFGAALDLKQSTLPGRDSSAEISAFLSHQPGSAWSLQGYVLTGLTDSSPDYGFGGVMSRSF